MPDKIEVRFIFVDDAATGQRLACLPEEQIAQIAVEQRECKP